MKVSELIAQLQNAQRLLGDIDCEVRIADPLSGEDPNQDSLPIGVEPFPSREGSYIQISTKPVAWR